MDKTGFIDICMQAPIGLPAARSALPRRPAMPGRANAQASPLPTLVIRAAKACSAVALIALLPAFPARDKACHQSSMLQAAQLLHWPVRHNHLASMEVPICS